MSSEIGRTAISTIFKSSYWKSCVDRISSLVEKAQCDSWRQDIGKHTTKQMNRSLFHLQPQPNLLCSSISTSWDLEQKDRWGVPVLSQPRQGRLGCLIKEQIEREKKKKKKASLSQMSAVEKSFWVWEVRWLREGMEPNTSPSFLFPVFNLQHMSQVWKRE